MIEGLVRFCAARPVVRGVDEDQPTICARWPEVHEMSTLSLKT